jgi:fructose-1,6-bisphosphatase/inositol monophosphatase family enzyme
MIGSSTHSRTIYAQLEAGVNDLQMLKHSSNVKSQQNIHLTSRLHAIYPDRATNVNRFVGEESYSKGASRDYLIDDSPTWCVDPLDG